MIRSTDDVAFAVNNLGCTCRIRLQLVVFNIICPQCEAAVVVSFPSVCVASGCRIDCSNQLCGYVKLQNPKGANVPLAENARSPFIV